MQRVDPGSVLTGALIGVLGYFVATVVAVPLGAPALVTLPAALLAAVVLVVAAAPATLGGAVTAVLRRRRAGTVHRGELLAAAAVAGALGGLVVAGVGAMASIGNRAVLSVPGVVLPVLVLTLAAVGGAALVRPRPERGVRYAPPAGDAGQASAESLGVVSVAALLVTALVVVMTPAGPWLRDTIRVALCEISGGTACGAAGDLVAETRPEPEHQCVLEDHRDDRDVALSVTWVQVEGGDHIRIEELPGERFRVSAEMSGGVGGQIGAGGGGSIVIDDQGYGVEIQAGVSAVAAAGGGTTWVVDGEREKDRLVDYLEGERDWRSVQSLLAGGGLAGSVASGIVDAGRQTWRFFTDAYEPGEADEVYAYAGVEGTGSANATGILNNAAADGAAATVLGARVDLATGATTMYFRSTVEGSATLQARGPESLDTGASGRHEVMLAVTYDPEGMPVTVQAQQLAAGDYKLQVASLFGDDVDHGDSGGFLYDARVSLTDEETRDVALGLLEASGIAAPSPAHRVRGGYDALTTFVDASRERGTLTRQRVDLEGGTSLAIQGGGEIAGVGLGGSFANSTSTITTTNADYWNGAHWQSWSSCAR